MAPLRLPTQVREAQEAERFGFTLPAFRPAPGSVPPKLDQSGFIRVQSQAKPREPLAKINKEPPRALFVLEAADEVVSPAHDYDVTVREVVPPPLHPPTVTRFQVDQRRARESFPRDLDRVVG